MNAPIFITNDLLLQAAFDRDKLSSDVLTKVENYARKKNNALLLKAVTEPSRNMTQAERAEVVASIVQANKAVAEAANTETRIVRKSLADFKRDVNQENTLIAGGWGKRGGTSMHVSTMGSGKSSLQTQAGLSFNRGVPCCGLTPTRPFSTWVIQSEDDEDRVAFDRDSIAEKLAAQYPDQDWNAAIRETLFLDFTGLTGVKFIETLDTELKTDPPDAVIVNPFNAFFGGDPMSHKDCSAFWKGGELGRHETEGIEAVVRRHNVWLWTFAHTPKPPTKSKELLEWLNNPYSAYSACGSSATPDAMRSIITFLKVPDTAGTFAFNAGKNGNGLGWTDESGEKTLRSFFKWSDDGKHFWCDVPKSQWGEIGDALGSKSPKKPTKPAMPPRDDSPVALAAFANLKEPIGKTDAAALIQNEVNAARTRDTYPKGFTRAEARSMLEVLKASGKVDCFGFANNMKFGTPDMIAALRAEKSGGEK